VPLQHPLHARGYSPPFDSPLHRLDARTKLVGLVALVIVAAGTEPAAFAAFAGYGLLVALGLVVGRVPAGYLLARWLIVLPFVIAAAALPFLHPADMTAWGIRLSRSGLLIAWGVAAKASLAVLAMTLLVGSTHFSDLLAAMHRLRVPGSLVAIVAMTFGYLAILADEAGRMRRARDARSFRSRWIGQAAVVGQMVGTLFLRSYERGERVHAAMLARGFDGSTVVASHHLRFGMLDWMVLTGWLAATAALRIAAG
jgi:cobalt/nickel transport system permease protein